ncbi:DedA family protein [Streptomyces sp. V3I7]|uniref:DedA family protein n=1 Tax=Streptomyces sp. V3I7 TaxID=3042278 RepID=UPI002787BECB|nr:VTT domain-containing protein [Streptomyces sp. V3I7]MDQ0992236.1 membrane-associated protein [Streptomyces sp. V3I7]
MTTLALGPSWLDPNYLLDVYGIWGLLLIVFAESGLLIGFFLPGDSLLFTCGLLITSHQLNFPLWGAIALICLAAVLGDQAGYMFGKKVGPSLFNRPDSRLFKQENVTKAHEFFEKYGPKSLVLARFVPVVRTFTPIIAGVSGMKYRSFLVFNLIGGVLWGAGVTLLGSWLGNIDVVKKNIEAILILIVLVSVVPIIIEFLRARSKEKKNPSAGAPAEHQAMDDATTQLRRVEPAYEQPQHHGRPQQHPYGNPQDQPQQRPQQPYGSEQGYDQYYGRPQQQRPYQQPQHPQRPQRPQQSYGQHQQPQAHQYPQQQPQAQPQQYPDGYDQQPYGSPQQERQEQQDWQQQYPYGRR